MDDAEELRICELWVCLTVGVSARSCEECRNVCARSWPELDTSFTRFRVKWE